MITPKKAEMGVGTLIVFIAMLLVAAVAAGVLIQTAGSLQEKSLSTGQQARAQISTNARVIEVSGTDGRNGNLTDFQEIMKLSPGSDPIKLDQIIFTFNTKDQTSTLKYRGDDCQCTKNNQDGYNTWNEENIGAMEVYRNITVVAGGPGVIHGAAPWQHGTTSQDFDDDGVEDISIVCWTAWPYCPAALESYIMINLTSAGPIYLMPTDENGIPVDIANPFVGFNFTADIGGYGYMRAWRTSGTNAYSIRQEDADVFVEFVEYPDYLEEDLDDDGLDDQFAVNATHAIFFLSSGLNISVNLGVDISGPACQNINLMNIPIENGTDTFAYLTLETACASNEMIPENATITISPYNLGKGYFTAIYEQEGTNNVPGNLQRGDILRLCYESPGEITEDDEIRLNFIPKIGTPTLTQFVTADVISTERTYLYP